LAVQEEYSIARPEPDEIAAIVALVNGAYRGESSRVGWTTEADLLDGQRTDAREISALMTAAESLILTARAEGQLIGCMHLEKSASDAMLGMFVISPPWQNRGLGRRMLAHAESLAFQSWGCERVLMAVLEMRDELIGYYERRGYKRTGQYRPFPDDVRFGVPKVSGLRFELMAKSRGH